MKQFSSLILFVLVYSMPAMLMAQNEANVWYFGNHAGLNFNYRPPKAISNPNMSTLEGCSSISDSSGNLLFYTDGRNVWNKRDSIMPYGTGLKGEMSSTHSSVIVKKPFSPSEYYIITADAGSGIGGPGMANNGVNYSEVNMDLYAGLGAVTLKNIPLVDISSEKIAVTPHKNGVYSWLIVPGGRSRAIYMYLVTENGPEFKYVDSSLFSAQIGSYGQIKFSPDGKRLAFLSQSNTVSVFNFNNSTGQLQLRQTITGGNEIYGVEFSPSGKYVYLSTWFTGKALCQCEVKSGNTSYTNDCLFYPNRNVNGQLQLGPDQKIYVNNYLFSYLGVINNPDSVFAKSDYIDSAVALLPNTACNLGLPTFHSGYLNVEHIKVKDICRYDTAYYSIQASKFTHDSLRWLIDGQPTTDTLPAGKHRFDTPGIYSIDIVFYNGTFADTFSRAITVRAFPITPNLTDTSVCTGDSFVCNVYRQPSVFYLWNTGDTNAIMIALNPGQYKVKLTLNQCSITDSFTLTHNPYPVINLPDETILCEGSTTSVSAAQAGASYLWSTGDTTASINISNKQTYWVKVAAARCATTDTFEVRTTVLPEIELGEDTTLCEGQPFSLNATFPYSTYLWNNTSTQPIQNIVSAGTYTVAVTNPCGTIYDTVDVSTTVCNCYVWAPNAFTPNGDQTNDLFYPQLTCDYKEYDLRVYNRWGQEVFKSLTPTNAWNGLYKGEALPSDVYVWKLSCLMVNKSGKQFTENQSGTVTLIR